MKFYRKYQTNIIESETILKCLGFLSTGRSGAKKAKAAAFYPFIFVRNHKVITPTIINHERIHFQQQIETLFIGTWLLTALETIYALIFLRLGAEERYLYRAIEQEAYRYQHDLDYLKKRKLFAQFKYIKDKKNLSFSAKDATRVIVGVSR